MDYEEARQQAGYHVTLLDVQGTRSASRNSLLRTLGRQSDDQLFSQNEQTDTAMQLSAATPRLDWRHKAR